MLSRTFTATDDCGNSTTGVQTITVTDTSAPEFTFVPADFTAECSEELPAEFPTAEDNCGEVTIDVVRAYTLALVLVLTRSPESLQLLMIAEIQLRLPS